MLKKINENLEMISFLIIISILTIVCIGSILVVYKLLTLKQYSYFLIFLLPLEIIAYILQKKKNLSFQKEEFLIFFLIICSTLSLIFSKNREVSLFGFMNRYEGYFMFLNYYSIGLLSSTLEDEFYKKIIIKFIIGIGLLNIVYGLFQVGILPKFSFIKDSWKYARGFEGNSMFFASLLSISYFFIISYFISSDNNRILKWILLILFTIGTIISGSMALICTTILLFIILFFKKLYIFIKTKNKKPLLRIIVCIFLFIIFNILNSYRDANYKRDVDTLSKEVTTAVEEKKVENHFGTGRIYIWKEVLKKSKDNLLLGVGIDNLFYSFKPRLIDPVSKNYIDKAHNDYLQKLYCEGLISVLIYITFLSMIFLKGIKKESILYKTLLLGFLAYSIQIFFSISVIRVTPIYWIVIGLLLSNEKNRNKKQNMVE